jgi:hypothetical protein
MTPFCLTQPRIHCATSQVISPTSTMPPQQPRALILPNIPSTAVLPPHTALNTTAPPDLSSSPASTPDQTRMHLLEESSLHGVPDPAPIICSLYRSSSTSVEKHDSVTTSLDSTQGPTDGATISPRANSDSDPLPTAAVSISTPHPLFAPSPSNAIVRTTIQIWVLSHLPWPQFPATQFPGIRIRR